MAALWEKEFALAALWDQSRRTFWWWSLVFVVLRANKSWNTNFTNPFIITGSCCLGSGGIPHGWKFQFFQPFISWHMICCSSFNPFHQFQVPDVARSQYCIFLLQVWAHHIFIQRAHFISNTGYLCLFLTKLWFAFLVVEAAWKWNLSWSSTITKENLCLMWWIPNFDTIFYIVICTK